MKEQLQKNLEKIRRQQDFFRSISLEEKQETSAGIDMLTHELSIEYNPNWYEIQQAKYFVRLAQKQIKNQNIKTLVEQIISSKTKEELSENTEQLQEQLQKTSQLDQYLEKRNISKPLVRLVEDTLYHEIGHRGTRFLKGCPRTFVTYSESILSPLEEATGSEDKESLAYLGNCLTDTINNTNMKQLTTMSGVYLFFLEQCQKEELSKFYEAHIRLNLFFNGDKVDQELLKPFFSFGDEINTAIQNFLKRTGISDMKTYSRNVKIKDKKQILNYLMNEGNWPEIAKIYGEEFGKLYKQQPQKNQLQGSGSKKGKPSSGKGKSSNGDKEPKFPFKDGFSEDLNNPKKQKKLIDNGRKAGKMPGWLTNFEYLLGLYELLAEDKVFELVPPKTHSRTYPLVDLNERNFDFEEDSVRDIIGVQFDQDSLEMELKVGKYKYSIPTKVRREVNNRPDFVFGFLDTSGSMKESMPKGKPLGDIVNSKAPSEQQWKYNSKYHVSLITYFMAVQRFEDLGVNESDAFFANFSRSTNLSRGLRNSLREALHPQFGGTQIEMDKVNDLLYKPGNFIFTISDGEIGNWQEFLDKIEEVVIHNPYFHVQIGDESDYSKALKEKGLFVKQVLEENELYDFIIDLTDLLYGGQQ